MQEPAKTPPSERSDIAVFCLLAGVVALGLIAREASAMEALGTIAFLAAVVLHLWLWQRTISSTNGPASRGQRAWGAVVFVAWAAGMAVLVWLYVANRADREPAETPAANPTAGGEMGEAPRQDAGERR